MSRITFGGLASGLDTNGLINGLLELERLPIVQNEERIKVLEQKKDAWRDINMRLRNLRSVIQELCKEENILAKQAYSTNSSIVRAVADPTAKNASYELKVDRLATNHTVAMQADIQSLLGKSAVESLNMAGVFLLNGVEIEVENGDSLQDLQSKINNSEANVEASIIAGHLLLKSGTSGTDGSLEMSYKSGNNVLNTLKIYNSGGGGSFYHETLEARDALLSINGISVIRPSNEIDDLIDGVTFNLLDESGESVYLQVSVDAERAAGAFAAFAEQYNSVNEFIREKLQKPEKNSIGDVGLLQGDTALMRIERSMRSLITSPVSNYRYETEEGWEQKKYYSFSSLGISTIDEEGYLQFDSEKLLRALEDDPEAVFELLKFEIEDENGVATGQFGGLAVTLDNYLRRLLISEQDGYGGSTTPMAVQQEQAIQRRIDELERRNEAREERILRYEERLIRQFTSLEKYISEMQSKGEDLARMIGQLSNQQNQK